MLVLVLVVVSVVAAYYCLIKPLSFWKNRNIDQADPLQILGDTLRGLSGKESLPSAVHRIYNLSDKRYAGFYRMGNPTLCIRDPELIKTFMVKDFEHFTDHAPFVDPEADPLWGNNLFAMRGQKWRDMRVTLSPAFTSSKMKFMFGLINEAAENFTQYFIDQKKDVLELELKDTLSRFTNDVIATIAFGLKVNSVIERNNEFYLMGKEATSFTTIWDTLRIVTYMVAPPVARHLKLTLFSARVSKFFRNLIKDTLETREKGNIVRPDMIHLLMEARKNAEDKNSKLTHDEVTAQALVFFFAGFESVSSAICFALYELAVNQEIQDQLREEINQTFEDNNGKLTYEVIQNMKYLEMVVSETLRKWPPFSAMDRICNKPYTIQPVNSAEQPVHMKLNTRIFYPIFGLHRDPKYFPDPEKFDPERFSEENKSKIVPYSYLPFGGGPRLCIGARFAILEIKIILFYLLRQFRVVPNEKSVIPVVIHPRTFSMTAKDGMHFNFEKLNVK